MLQSLALDKPPHICYDARMNLTEQPIIVRAAITQEEWRELRKLAIDRGQHSSQLVAIALREYGLRETGNTIFLEKRRKQFRLISRSDDR